jgi:predicted RNA-binding Zn-ribbon protein involved in translation (DUF1610 family)
MLRVNVEIHCPSCGTLVRRCLSTSSCPDCGDKQAIFLSYCKPVPVVVSRVTDWPKRGVSYDC